MSELPETLGARLRNEGEKTIRFFRQIPSDCWDQTVYSDGMVWSVRQVLAHFVATEAGMQGLVHDVLAGGSGAPEGFDINDYNARKVARLESSSPDELLGEFHRLRGISANLVEGMAAEDFQRSGRHPWLGMTTLEEIIKLLYIHIQIHQRDIRRVIPGAV
jgi:hypothetical protein